MNELAYILEQWDLILDGSPMPIIVVDKTRVDLAKMFKDLKYRKGAEIGTARGSYAITMRLNNPNVELYCIDAWLSYDGLDDYPDQGILSNYYISAQKRLEPYKNIKIINDLSMDAVKQFADGSLDFVYIDANHQFPYVAEDVFYWSKKVRKGGIVAGHDYLLDRREDGFVHVKEVIHAYTEAFDISPWFVVDKCTKKRAGSWFWVKR